MAVLLDTAQDIITVNEVRKTVGGFSLKPTAKLFGAHQCNEPNQPPSRGFPEGHIATTVHGVVRVEQLNEGRF